ncbi:MAG TPA: thioredoxin domain-containing protein [Trueperaceae bacterium]|nr:thioredoxin domain-containing protein [Trueperaceae bacterium]
MKNTQTLTIATVAVVAVILLAAIIIPRLGGGTAPVATGNFDYDSQPVAGSPDAPVKVALFFDFLCPHCAEFGETVTPILKREFVEPGTAAIYFYNFPVIDPVISRSIGMVAECTYQQSNDAFLALEPILLRSRADLASLGTNAAITARAVSLALQYGPNLDAAALNTCVSESATGPAVDADAALARSLQLGGTPSVLVNGALVSNPTLDNIRRAIQSAAN